MSNILLEQLVQKLDSGKGKKIWVDKSDKFDGKIGDTVENWLKGWELWFKHREKQDGEIDERTKIETAIQNDICSQEIDSRLAEKFGRDLEARMPSFYFEVRSMLAED